MIDTLYTRAHRRWHHKAEAKVMARSSEYAEIEARRHKEGRNTVTFLSDDDNLTMAHWDRQQEIFESIAPRPWWIKILAYRHWNQWTLGGVRGRIDRFVQRGRRGWSNQDAWSAHWYLAQVISEMARHLEKNSSGYPANSSPEEWEQILGRIAAGFEAAMALDEKCLYKPEDQEERDALETSFDEGMELFHKWFFSLWD